MKTTNKNSFDTNMLSASPLTCISIKNNPLCHSLIRTAVTGVLLSSSGLYAQTLSQAVNAQLEQVSIPCERLLGGDLANLVLVGNLASDICGRAFAAGATSQDTSIGSANSSSLSGDTLTLLQHAQGNEKKGQASVEAQLGSQWTLFMTADAGTLNRDVTVAEDGYKSSIARLLVGSTYTVNPTNTIGVAITTQRHTGDYVGGGDFKDSATGVRLLESYHPTAQLFFQAVAGYDSVSSQRTRTATFSEYVIPGTPYRTYTGTPTVDYSYNQTELSVLGGYNSTHGGFTLTPQVGLTWLMSDYGSYVEAGNSGLELVIHNDKRESLQSSLGIQGTYAMSTGFGVMIPQFDVRWKHEFADNSRQVDVSFAGDTRGKIFSYDTQAADKDFYELSAGIAFVYSKGVQSFLRVQTVLGQEYYHNNIATIGLNLEL
jgi:hypothetical protein